MAVSANVVSGAHSVLYSTVDGAVMGCDLRIVAVEVTYPHIVKEPGKPARLEQQPRTRVSMIVRDHLEGGLSPQDIVRQYPYLKRAEVYSALAYYFDHQEEIDRELAEENRLMEEASGRQQPAVAERLKALKKGGNCP